MINLFFLLFLSLLFPSPTFPKFVIEPCNSSAACPALLSYLLPSDSKLSQISSLFQINLSLLLSANSIHPALSSPATRIVPARTPLRIPVSCTCVDGIRRSMTTRYTVQVTDTIDSISASFGRLVRSDQIVVANGIDRRGGVAEGQSLVIPLPCACFGNEDNGVAVVYISVVVREGQTLGALAADYGTTVTDLVAVNGLGDPFVYAGDILAVPIPACSSSKLILRNETLIVPNASYALTANDCVQCSCGPNNLNLHCFPSPLTTSCSNFKCKGAANIVIGDVYQVPTKTSCKVSSCLYRGHVGHKLLNSMSKSTMLQCTGNVSHSSQEPSPSNGPFYIPVKPIPPSPNPSSHSPPKYNETRPRSEEDFDTSEARQTPKHASYLLLFLLQLFFHRFFIRYDSRDS